jgi:hypothetical protein
MNSAKEIAWAFHITGSTTGSISKVVVAIPWIMDTVVVT